MNGLFYRKVDYSSSGTENNDTLQVDYLYVFFLKLQKEKYIIKEMLPFEIEAVVHGIISSGGFNCFLTNATNKSKYVSYRKVTKGTDFWKTLLDGYISNIEIQNDLKLHSHAMW